MSSPVVNSIESPTPAYTRRRDERRIAGVNWRRVGRLPNAHRRHTQSVVWMHGDSYVKVSLPREPPSWICDHCDVVIKLQAAGSTTNHLRHLQKAHLISQQSTRDTTSISIDDDDDEVVERTESIPHTPNQFQAMFTTINIDRFRHLLLRLFILCQLPYSLVERPEFRQLMIYIQPMVEKYLPRSHTTIGDWVVEEFHKGKETLKSTLAQAKSRIHISFNVWTSPMGTPILGICGHFLYLSLELRHPLLALRFLQGHHTGEVIAELVRTVMEEYGIVDKWGVCISDNASNNDTTCERLVRELRPGEPTTARRARCIGHIVNLAAKAFIYGQNNEGFITEAERVVTLQNRDQMAIQAEMAHWRQRGAFGKFHNIVKWIRGGTLRSQRFEELLKAFLRPQIDGDIVITEVERDIEPVHIDEIHRPITQVLHLQLDNATRWNSAFEAIQRGLRLKQVLVAFIATEPGLPELDILSHDDWTLLEAIYFGLKPFWEVSKQLQGHATTGSHGCIWEVLPAIEMLLTHCESHSIELTALQGTQHQDTPPPPPRTRLGRPPPLPQLNEYDTQPNPLLICYNNAWEVLRKYYSLTDQNQEIYALGTLLNPCMKKQYFTHSWTGETANAIEPMIEKNRGIWETEYRPDMPAPVSEVPRSSLSIFMARTTASTGQIHQNDDFLRYVNGAAESWTEWNKENLFQWWNACGFPGLRQIAFDTLSIPAMSAELERVFSQSKRFLTDDRNRLLVDHFEALQCLRQWSSQKVHDIMDSDRMNVTPANQVAPFA